MISPRKPLLPRRDYILLPLVAGLTVVSILLLTEIGSRILWPRQEEDACALHTPVGVRFRPHCSARVKTPEAPWTTNTYNECGYRTDDSCGPKSLGDIRLAVLGSSMAHGLFVPYDETLARKTGELASKEIGHPVQVENLGVPGQPGPLDTYHRLNEVIALDPDAVVLVISPADLRPIQAEDLARRDDPIGEPTTSGQAPRLGVTALIHNFVIGNSTAALMAQHFLFQNTDTYIRASLYSNEKSAYLLYPFSADLENRFDGLRILITDMSAKLKARNIPLIIVALPSCAEAALLVPSRKTANLAPYAFGDRLRDISLSSGATYVDVMHAFAQVQRPETLYYIVNGHMTGEGQVLVAQQLAPAVVRAIGVAHRGL